MSEKTLRLCRICGQPGCTDHKTEFTFGQPTVIPDTDRSDRVEDQIHRIESEPEPDWFEGDDPPLDFAPTEFDFYFLDSCRIHCGDADVY